MYNPKGVKPIQIVQQCLFSFKKIKKKKKITSKLQFLNLRPVINLATQVGEE